MIKKVRIKLARWILGNHCACYQMGYHPLVDFQKRSQEQMAAEKNKSA
jgi:hypothetical protein